MNAETKVTIYAYTERTIYGIVSENASEEEIEVAYAEASDVFQRITQRQLTSIYDPFN